MDPANDPTVLDLFAAAQRRRGLLPSTIDRRRADLVKMQRHLGDRPLLEATSEDVEAFLDGRRWEPCTTYAFISHLHAFFVWASTHGLAGADPTLPVDRPRLRPGLPRPIDSDDLAYLLTIAPPVERCWLLLGSHAGLRCAEMAALCRGDINAEHLRVMGKGHKERLVPVHPVLRSALVTLPMPAWGHLFAKGDGSPVDGTYVSARLNRWMRDQGVDCTAHRLRHWFATMAYRQCHDVLAVAGLLGHANPTMTARYAQFSPTVAADAVMGLTIGAAA